MQFSLGVKHTVVLGQETQLDKTKQVKKINKYLNMAKYILSVDGGGSSFNFTYAAESRNAENLLIITGDPQLVEQYIENWKDRQSQSDPYTPKVEE
ncbi:MAG: hypothetical protein TV41_04020 [Wolbachia endosymbiont of Dactylopius coccus]|nr:MAG: hypothetical protein TV41_04020 [Wolbachia endosymbiont of Dactylopius coccus]